MGAGYRVKAKAGAPKAAEIFIYEDIGGGFWDEGVTAKQFAIDLKALGSVDTIDLRINSFGGQVFEGVAIYRQLVEHPATVTAHIDGVAASIASVIAMAGNKIVIAEAGMMMIHNASGVAMGDAATMRQMADLLDTLNGTIADVYKARTGRTADDLRAMMDAETWMTADEAIANGFAQSKVENLSVSAHAAAGVVAPQFNAARHKFQHPPAAIVGRPRFNAAALAVARMQTAASRRALQLRAA